MVTQLPKHQPRLEQLNFQDVPFDSLLPDFMATIGFCTQLRKLVLSQVSGKVAFARLERLEQLSLWDSPHLETLDLTQLPTLTELEFKHDHGFIHLLTSQPWLATPWLDERQRLAKVKVTLGSPSTLRVLCVHHFEGLQAMLSTVTASLQTLILNHVEALPSLEGGEQVSENRCRIQLYYTIPGCFEKIPIAIIILHAGSI